MNLGENNLGASGIGAGEKVNDSLTFLLEKIY